MQRLVLLVLSLFAGPASGQTVVEMDLPSATKLLRNHKLSKGAVILEKMANNYKQFTNVRVHSTWYEESIATLFKALRTDFDGAGTGYIPEMNIWAVHGATGSFVYLAASQVQKNAILLSSDVDYLKGMIAFEILEGVRKGSFTLPEAQRRALAVGIEMQVSEDSEGEQTITFFGHQGHDHKIVGKLIVIEPPDLAWN